MKIFVINGENFGEKIEIEINEFLSVKELKYDIDEILQGNENWAKNYFRLIYKNMILNDQDYNYIKQYKLCENDEIWFGKIENYLRDDVIVEVFLAGLIPDWLWLIVNTNDAISTIRSMIERLEPEINNIWDWEGHEIRNDQIITEIDSNGYYRLIVSCDVENEQILTFEDCRDQHDQFRIEFYYLEAFYVIPEVDIDEIINQMKEISQIISSNDVIDDRLNLSFSSFPTSFINSNFLFCANISAHIWDICEDIWELIEDQYEENLWKAIYEYFPDSLLFALNKFSDARRDQQLNANKSFKDIVIDAFDFFIDFLSCSNGDWQYWARLWMKAFLFTSRPDSEIDRLFRNRNPDMLIATIEINDCILFLKVRSSPQRIIEMKQAISNRYEVNNQDLYCINIDKDKKPNDEDQLAFEITFQYMNNIENLDFERELTRGGFGSIILCRDKISGKKLVIKKSIDLNCCLHRDIFINYKICRSDKLFKYSGIVRDKNSIYMVMEYIPGGSLTSYIKQTKCLSEHEIIKISYQILIQINEFHKLEIIHRDIKPDNIILNEEKNPKLIDYGLAKYTTKLGIKDMLETLKAYTPGTINYMAPELIKEESYSSKIDIWSFGMVMVEMVTGKCPFYWTGYGQILLELGTMQKYRFKPTIPISNVLKQFISSCLTANPDERPTGQQLITSELFSDFVQMHNNC